MIFLEMYEEIKLIYNLIKKQINRSVQELGLTCSQSGILIYILLNKNEQLSQRDIEHIFNLSNPTVNGILNRLEKKEFIKREVSSIDKRIKYIYPLKKAEEFEKKLEQQKEIDNKIMLKNINEQELNIFYSVLGKIKSNLKENLDERNI